MTVWFLMIHNQSKVFKSDLHKIRVFRSLSATYHTNAHCSPVVIEADSKGQILIEGNLISTHVRALAGTILLWLMGNFAKRSGYLT